MYLYVFLFSCPLGNKSKVDNCLKYIPLDKVCDESEDN